MKKKIAISLLSVLAATILLLQIATPSILRSYLNDHGRELLGRDIYLKDVSVNVLEGSVTLESLTIYGQQPDDEPFVQIRQGKANLAIYHLLAGVIDFEYLKLDGLSLNIEQRDTVFNFSDILLKFSEDETSASKEDDGLPIVLRDIAITNSYLHYRDLLVHSDFRINDIDLRIPGIDLRELNTSVGMNLSFIEGGSLNTRFTYDERKKTYSLDMTLSDFNMQGLLPYIQQYLQAERFGGTLNGNVQMNGSIQHVLDFRMTGNAKIRDLSLSDDDDNEVLACDSLNIGISELNLLKNRIGLSFLTMNNPTIEITYGKDSIDTFTRMINLAAMRLAKEGSPISLPEEPASDNQPEFQLDISQFQINEGHLFYHDLATQIEPFHYQIGDISLNAPHFSLSGINNVKGKALLGHGGSITLEYHGKVNDPENLRFNLSASGIELNDFSPYTLQMFGNEVIDGNLSGTISATVYNKDLSGTIHLIAKNPQVSKRRKGIDTEMHVPFRAGIYALTDKNGLCDIELPMSGNINDPRFSYKRLIFRTLGKLFVKVSTSPFQKNANIEYNLTNETIFNDFNIEDIELDSFGNDSIGKKLMDEEYE